MANSEKSYRRKQSIFIRAVVVVFALFCGITIFTQLVSYLEMEEETEELEEQIYLLNEDIAELKDELAQEIDEEYLTSQARKLLSYHLPEEVLFYSDNSD